MVKLGVIGLSEGNGHPFSFSAILNGFNDAAFEKSNWPGIHSYLKRRDLSEIATLDARVTHVWTQEQSLSRSIAESCLIDQMVDDFHDMIGQVDAVLLARDDFELHKEMSEPFLKNGIPVFIDKPLALDINELEFFKPFLEEGLLMSCSGFRYCCELDDWREEFEQFGNVKLISAVVVNGWDKYGIHMIDAVLAMSPAKPVCVESLNVSEHEAVNILMSDGSLFQVNALGPEVLTFSLQVFGSDMSGHVIIRDNFTAFRRTLYHFIEQVKYGKPTIDPQQTLLSIKTLIAGRKAIDERRRVMIEDLSI